VLSGASPIRSYTWLVLLLLLCEGAVAQLSPSRERLLPYSPEMKLDTLSVFPGRLSIFCGNQAVPDSLFSVHYADARIIWNKQPGCDTLLFRFQVMPFRIRSSISHKEQNLYLSEEGRPVMRYRVGSAGPASELMSDEGLNKSGSISRGIAFGNAQNLSVNSSLNLQLNGRLTDRYSLLASVSDDNIPIQPEGNSQQLQDFDQVFIQVFDERNKLIAGDFILRRPPGYFMNYFKRAQGAYVSSTAINPGSENRPLSMTVEASASVSKGRFARQVIQGIEGNQGPYRLRGDNNELFIVVLAGTEAVYIDGRLMERGQDKDYIIDYNAAEITFTPRQLITKDRRITVEFQYSDKRFARPMFTTSLTAVGQHTKSHLNFFSEHDARNQPLQQDLDGRDKAILAAAGDHPLNAITTGIDSVGFSNSAVLYALRDSLGFDSVLVYSTRPDSAVYRVIFSFVGQGNGDYVEAGFTANGRTFRWIAPIASGEGLIRQGSYAPVQILFAPQKRQMLTAGIEWHSDVAAKQGHTLRAEAAYTVNDQNTFSSLDSGDDQGFGWKGGYTWKRAAVASRDSLTRGKTGWEVSAGYEYTARDFTRVERFREVEFERNWNIGQLDLRNDQHIASAQIVADIPGAGKIGAGGDTFVIGSGYTGRKAQAWSRIQTAGGTKAVVNASWLNSIGQVESSFIRHKGDWSQQFRWLRLGFRDEHEYNRIYSGPDRNLSSASYRFYDWEISAGNADTTRKQISVFYRDRWEERPAPGLSRATRADHYGISAGFSGTNGNRIRMQAYNRRLRVVDPEIISAEPENTLLLRSEYTFRWWNGLLQGTSFYEVGSGLEQRREFIYLEVPPGQGNYVWIDYNGDGVRDLNEFEIAQFAYEANFIRSFIQTNEYAKTFTNQFSQTLWITPAQWWKKPGQKWQRMLNRFSNQASYRIDRKTQQEKPEDRLNPFLAEIADTSLLALNRSFRNVLFFNKSNPRFGADVTYQDVGSKSLLSNGFESRTDGFVQLAVRWNFFRELTLLAEYRDGRRIISSDVFTGRNYEINQRMMRPRINWQPSVTARFAVFGEYAEKNNADDLGGESALIRKAGVEWTANRADKGLATASFQLVSIAYTGTGTGPLAFDMLEGLVPGVSMTWGAGVQRTIARNLQLNLQYNGRKPGELSVIHSGAVQVRAFF